MTSTLNSLINTIFQVATRVWQREPRILVRTTNNQFDVYYTKHHPTIIYIIIHNDDDIKVIIAGQVIDYMQKHHLIKAIMNAKPCLLFGQTQSPPTPESELVHMMNEMCSIDNDGDSPCHSRSQSFSEHEA